jgi:hypothetical protein
LPVSDDHRHLLITPWRVSRHGALSGPVPLSAVALLQRSTGSDGVEVLPPAQALLRIVGQSIGTEQVEVPMFHRLATLARTVPVVELRYDDTATGIELLRTLAADGVAR